MSNDFLPPPYAFRLVYRTAPEREPPHVEEPPVLVRPPAGERHRARLAEERSLVKAKQWTRQSVLTNVSCQIDCDKEGMKDDVADVLFISSSPPKRERDPPDSAPEPPAKTRGKGGLKQKKLIDCVAKKK